MENLGKNQKPFLIKTLKQYITDGQYENAKGYVLSYFVKLIGSPITIGLYHPDLQKFDILTEADIKKRYLTKSMIMKKSSFSFDIQKWFFEEVDDEYLFCNELFKNFVFCENGRNYINLCKGFKHKIKSYDDYNNDVKSKVACILNHIKEVLCCNNKKLYEYILNWLACICNGRKMTTLLYFNSIQGTGKSIITEFLQEHVLGYDMVTVDSDPNILFGYNEDLTGKILMVLEEMPANSQREWFNITNKLKHFVTGKTLKIKEKYKNTIEIKNMVSIIVVSNNKALQLTSDSRREVCLDISEHRVSDFEYFNHLVDCINGDLVGEAFYNFMNDRFNKINKSFKENIIPNTNFKKELVITSLNCVYEYIKLNFIKNKKDIDMKFSDFYEKVLLQYDKKMSKIEVSKLLKRIGIVLKKQSDGKRHIHATHSYLLKLFLENKWIHETDDINDEVNEPKTKNKNDFDEINIELMDNANKDFKKPPKCFEIVNDDDKDMFLSI